MGRGSLVGGQDDGGIGWIIRLTFFTSLIFKMMYSIVLSHPITSYPIMSHLILHHLISSRVVTTSFVYFVFIIYLFSVFPSCTSLSLSHNSFTCVCVCVSCCNKSLVSSISPFIIFRYDYTVNRIRCLDAAKSGLILLNCSYR